MIDCGSWSWEEEKRPICDVRGLQQRFEDVHELVVSPDGERIAAPVLTGPDTFAVCVNGELWDGELEKAWHLTFSPDGRLTALVRVDDEWTLAVEGELWDGRWEFAWNTSFNRDGSVIALQVKDNMQYTVAVNDEAWEQRFHSSRGLAVGDGKVAAIVQVQPLSEGDIFGFMEGTWTVAVDGVPWERRFINAYSPAISPDGASVAAEVRLDICEYTLAENEVLWEQRFACVWEPLFSTAVGGFVAPVRSGGAWALHRGGSPIWKNRYMQLWNVRECPLGKRMAAVVAPSFGRWTVAVDDVPWGVTFDDLVLPPVFSADGKRVAAGLRDGGMWSIAVDGTVWPERFDMVWDPVFSPAGSAVVAKVQRDGQLAVAVDGKVWSPWFEALWEPIFSPDGRHLLIRAIDDGTYYRLVVPFAPTFQAGR